MHEYSVKELVPKAIQRYQADGLAEVLVRAKRVSKAFIRDMLLFPRGAITRQELLHNCRRDGRLWYYGRQTEFEINAPLTNNIPESFEPLMGTRKCPRSFVCELENVRLLGPYAIPQTKRGRFVLEEMGTRRMLGARLQDTYRILGLRRRIQDQLAQSIGGNRGEYDCIINLVPRHGREPGHPNYGHWLLEDLPRLRGYRKYHEATGRQPRLLLMPDPPSWMRETLELIGFGPSKWIEWKHDEALVSRLVIPKLSCIHSRGMHYQPSDRAWVSRQLKSNVDLSIKADLPDRIFVSRQGQRFRSIANIDEVMEVLSERGFHAIRPEEFTIADQVRIFHHADVIAGPFGAGLTNMVFSEDATLIDILPPKRPVDTVYYILANENGIDYRYVEGEEMGGQETREPRDRDIWVNPTRLSNVIEDAV